jgi:hypothetical protein
LKALEIIKKHCGEDHVEYAFTLEGLCNTLECLVEYEKAKEGYLKVILTKKKYFGE